MRNALRKIDRRFQLSRPGSVLILVVALLVLMALIGTAFLSTTRVDRYATVQHTNNTEIDLLVEGVKNMAKATIVGSLNDPSLPFAYRPANSTLAKNWDGYDLYHQYTTDPAIGTTPNDAWLSPRTPTDLIYPANAKPPAVVWQCIGEPLTGNTFESPFVENTSGALVSGVPLTYTDRVTGSYAGYSGFVPPPIGSTTPGNGNLLTPTFASISYPDGTTATFPAFTLTSTAGTFTYLAGDADGDGIADSGMFKLPVGQINGLTYYASVRIIDNSGAVNVNTAMSRRYDFNAAGFPTRYVNSTGTVTYGNGIFNLGCFESNVGLAEMLESYDGKSADNSSGNISTALGTEFGTWLQYVLNSQNPSGVVTTAGSAPTNFPIFDNNTARSDFAFTTVGDMLSSQVGRRPSNPGQVSSNYACQPFTDTDAAAICYHFVFNNPNAARAPIELALHNSVYDDSPNGEGEPPNAASVTGPPTRPFTNSPALGYFPGPGSTSYVGTPSNSTTVVQGWYTDNFDWLNDFQIAGIGSTSTEEGCLSTASFIASNAGQYNRPRRSILTADSAVSNLVPQPQLTLNGQPAARPFTVSVGTGASAVATTMSPITSTLCKTSINTGSFPDLWRAYWLAMTADNGLSPLGTNSGSISGAGYTEPGAYSDHDLTAGQSIYTGSQFANPPPADHTISGSDGTQAVTGFQTPYTAQQHPQAMFRSTLRDPRNVFYQNGTGYYIEADQMVLLRSAIAAANVTAMRYPVKGSSAPIFAYDVPLSVTVGANQNAATIYARVYGVTQQPYITEVYANTNISPSADPGATNGKINTHPYIAIELFNPYNQAINLNGWQLATVNRDPTDANGNDRKLTVLHNFGATDIVPAYTAAAPTTGTVQYQAGYALLEDFNASSPGSNGVMYRPLSTGLDAAANVTRAGSPTTGGPLNDIFVTELANLIPSTGSYANEELVLLRPINGNGTAESPIDQVPVDSFDFTGLNYNVMDTTLTPPLPVADVWHYVRGNGVNTATNSDSLWRFIYPGRYDATDPTPYAVTVASSPVPPVPATSGSGRTYPAYTYAAWSRRQQGTQAARYRPTSSDNISAQDPFSLTPPAPPISLGGSAGVPSPNDNSVASYPVTFPFQYVNNDQPGPSALTAAPGINNFPFGQFARNSDMLQVPFVGSYMLFSAAPSASQVVGLGANAITPANVIEVNPLPMDCSFAEDTDLTDDPPASDASASGTLAPYIWNESVGHFAPINTGATDTAQYRTTLTGDPYLATTIADSDPTLSFTSSTDPYQPYKMQYSTDVTATPTYRYWRYHWASRLFDYLTVQNPNDDYFPNVQQALYTGSPVNQPSPMPVQNSASISPAANTAVVPAMTSGNTTAIAASPNTEDTVPVYGLININTAPWRVLAALRLCPYDDAELVSPGVYASDQFTIDPFGGAATPNPDSIPDNVELAEAIANWRDFGPTPVSGTTQGTVSTQVNNGTVGYQYGVYKGPFRSASDLLNVPAVQNYIEQLSFQSSSAEPNAVFGHLSPFDFYANTPAYNAATPPALLTDGVRNDVEERYDLLDRISNQVTCKSDVYTVYIVVQGWRNAGSSSASNPPQLVTQRRAAFIIDRTGVTPTSSNVKIINVPTN
jgi:hypothetical protein